MGSSAALVRESNFKKKQKIIIQIIIFKYI